MDPGDWLLAILALPEQFWIDLIHVVRQILELFLTPASPT